MLSLADIYELAENVVFYDADRDPCRVAIAGAGVGVSRGLSFLQVGSTGRVLKEALCRKLGPALALGEEAMTDLVCRRLVQYQVDDLESMSGSILVCGSELVGQEEPAAAESRARSMRAFLVAELQRALAGDEPPVTVRRSAPPSSVEAR